MMKKKQVLLMMLLVVILMMHSTALAGSGSRMSAKKEQEIEMINLPISEIIYQESPIVIKPPTSHPTIELPFPEALIVEEPLPEGIEDIASKQYIKMVLKGINATRKEYYDNKPLTLRDDLVLIAKAHALEMAKKQKQFHSKYNVYEAVSVGDYALLKYGEGVGGGLAIHNFAFTKRTDLKGIGIGAYTRYDKNGRRIAYICAVTSTKDHVPLEEVK